MSKRFYRKPKFGWRPPGIRPHHRHKAPGIKRSGHNLDGSGEWAATKGGVLGKLASRLLHRWRTKRRKQLRPSKLPKSYRVDVE